MSQRVSRFLTGVVGAIVVCLASCAAGAALVHIVEGIDAPRFVTNFGALASQ